MDALSFTRVGCTKHRGWVIRRDDGRQSPNFEQLTSLSRQPERGSKQRARRCGTERDD